MPFLGPPWPKNVQKKPAANSGHTFAQPWSYQESHVPLDRALHDSSAPLAPLTFGDLAELFPKCTPSCWNDPVFWSLFGPGPNKTRAGRNIRINIMPFRTPGTIWDNSLKATSWGGSLFIVEPSFSRVQWGVSPSFFKKGRIVQKKYPEIRFLMYFRKIILDTVCWVFSTVEGRFWVGSTELLSLCRLHS